VPKRASSAARNSVSRMIDQRPSRGGIREPGDSKAASKIRFDATLFRPKASAGTKAVSWTFLTLPREASAKLSARGLVSIEGTFNGFPIHATLEPDGLGGHWLKVQQKMAAEAGAEAGDVVTLEIVPVALGKEPEPTVPPDLRKALAAAPKAARGVWSDITPIARRDWIQWITSGKRAETRVKRIAMACDMLAQGKRRPCCFDRSGMYGKSVSCPVAEDASSDTKRQLRSKRM
jgi:hypothetical protein